MDYVDFIEGLYFYFVKNKKRSNSANCSAEYDDVCRKLSDLHFTSLFRGHETVSESLENFHLIFGFKLACYHFPVNLSTELYI